MPVYPDGTQIHQAEWYRLIQSIPSSYTIWKDGATYRAEANISGGTDLTDADISSLLNNVIDTLPAGGKIYVQPETYTLAADGTVNLDQINVILEGSGWGTIFTTADTDLKMFDVSASGVFIKNLKIKQAVAGVAGNIGINLDPAASIYDCYIEDVYLQNLYDGIISGKSYGPRFSGLRIYETVHDGIKITDANDQYIESCLMDNVADSTGNGIEITKTGGTWITDCDIMDFGYGLLVDPPAGSTAAWIWACNSAFDSCLYDGVKATNAAGATAVINGLNMYGGWVSGNQGNGITLDGIDNSIIQGLQIQDNHHHGIQLSDPTYSFGTRIHSNEIQSNNDDAGSYDGIRVDAGVTYFTITNNSIRLDNDYDIYVAAGASDNYIIQDNLLGVCVKSLAGLGTFEDNGTGTVKRVRNNVGISGDAFYEKRGVNTGTGAQQTIAHGLGVYKGGVKQPPNWKACGNIVSGANPYYSAAADGTNIYITAVAPHDYWWEVAYEE